MNQPVDVLPDPPVRPPSVSRIANVRPWGGDPRDIEIVDGRITGPSDGGPGDAEGIVIDGRGLLALPGIVNTHAHIDKSWWGLPWQPYGGEGGVEGRIRHERARRDELGIPSVALTRAVLGEMVRHGTTAIRSHVDVDTGLGLRGIEVVREAVAEYDGALHLEIVAFPQDGVLRRPGVLDLLEAAAGEGVEHIGGLDPATIDRDPVGQIDGLFAIADGHGVGIDIHLHEPAELGVFQIELIADRVESLGLTGKVNIAHGFAVAQIDSGRRRDLLDRMAVLGITMTTVAPMGRPQLPFADLEDAGVRFGFGTDGIRDLWSPYGTGDTMGIAWQYSRSSGLVRDADLARVVEMATSSAGWAVGGTVGDLTAGSRADLVLLDALNPMDALVRCPPREVVVGNGRLLYQR